MSSEEPKNIGGAKKKGGKIALIVCIVVIVALLGVVIFLLTRKEEEGPRRNVVVNEDNVAQIIEEMEESERVPQGSYEMTMNSTWHFDNGASASDNAYVENSVTNTNPVYFDIARSDTEETIFESPILPLGSHLDSITLDENLPAGTYDCVMTYHLLDENDESISTVNVSLTIVIEN